MKSGPSGGASSSGISQDEFRSLRGPSGLKRRASTAMAARQQQQRQRRRANSSTGASATGPGHPIRPQSGVWRGLAERGEGRVRPLRALDYEVHRAREVAEKAERFGLLSALRTSSQGLRERPPADHLGVSSGEKPSCAGHAAGPAGAREGGGAPRSSRPHEGRAHDAGMGWRRARSRQIKQGMTTPLECRRRLAQGKSCRAGRPSAIPLAAVANSANKLLHTCAHVNVKNKQHACSYSNTHTHTHGGRVSPGQRGPVRRFGLWYLCLRLL